MVLTQALFTFSTLLSVTQAVHIPLQGRGPLPGKSHVSPQARVSGAEFAGRASSRFFQSRASTGLTGSTVVGNENNIGYHVNITLAGAPYTVLMDTGSSDLWVASEPNSGFESTGFNAGVQFVEGSAQGPVMTADLEFSGIPVSNQAFIFVTPSEQQPVNQGLIGLGPFTGSSVVSAVDNAAADPALDRIFQQEASTETFITVQLGRALDPETPPSGDLTVGEVLPQYSNISSMPKLPVPTLPEDQHWQTLNDPNGIAVNGKPITTPTNASANIDPNAANTLSFIFDTGFTFPQVPGYVADAIYSDVSGAQKQNIEGLGVVYTMPCTSEVNITFSFGGQTIPIHPLDAVVPVTQNGQSFCIGSFQEALPGVQSAFEDGNLGMAFLRNVYMLINFGSLAQGAPAGTAAPYIQLLPLTNPAQAHADFINERVNKDTTSPGSSGSGGTGTGTTKKSGALRIASPSGALWALLLAGVVSLLFSLA